MRPGRDITLSVVSHGQNALVNALLGDLGRCCADRIHLVLTENIPDPVPLATAVLSCPVERIANPRPQGFGANHNQAFRQCATEYFCVCNPDVRLHSDPFGPLCDALRDPRIAVSGPRVLDPAGHVEDSARRFPTFGALARKFVSDRRAPDYPADGGPHRVDWIAGMFMLFRSPAYRDGGGFDERYFLYYEDVDICRRLHRARMDIAYVPQAEIVHDARRGSRRTPRLAAHHLRSAIRYFAGV